MPTGIGRLGATQQRLLRQLLLSPDGCPVDTLCERLAVTHNAVRQHLVALCGKGYVERVQSRATGGRPQSRFALTGAGRDLFPKNYGAISGALVAHLVERMGDEEVGRMLADLGRQVAASQPVVEVDDAVDGPARALAGRLDALGYEAVPARHGEEWQVEAFNCVFHSLARAHPQVCKFDIAYMEATMGRRIHHMECIVRGGHVCRFRLGPLSDATLDAPYSFPP